MSDTSNPELIDNHDKRQDNPDAILDMSLEDILRLGLTSPVEDIEDDLSRDSVVDNEIGPGSGVWGDNHSGDGFVCNNDDEDNELVSSNEDQHQYATRAEANILSEYVGQLRDINNSRFDYLFDREADQQQQLKALENLLTVQEQEIEQYKKVLADFQHRMNKQSDLISKQEAQILQLEKRLSKSG